MAGWLAQLSRVGSLHVNDFLKIILQWSSVARSFDRVIGTRSGETLILLQWTWDETLTTISYSFQWTLRVSDGGKFTDWINLTLQSTFECHQNTWLDFTNISGYVEAPCAILVSLTCMDHDSHGTINSIIAVITSIVVIIIIPVSTTRMPVFIIVVVVVIIIIISSSIIIIMIQWSSPAAASSIIIAWSLSSSSPVSWLHHDGTKMFLCAQALGTLDFVPAGRWEKIKFTVAHRLLDLWEARKENWPLKGLWSLFSQRCKGQCGTLWLVHFDLSMQCPTRHQCHGYGIRWALSIWFFLQH